MVLSRLVSQFVYIIFFIFRSSVDEKFFIEK